MSYTFDYFVGNLKCGGCGAVSSSDEATNIQTKIGLHPAMTPFGVGAFIEIDVGNIERSGYFCIRKPQTSAIFSVVETWECPNCGVAFNWVLIEINNGIIQSLESVNLDEGLAVEANYITEECTYCGWGVKDGKLVRAL